MRCSSCGNENRDGARFCDSCGATLEAAPAAPSGGDNGDGDLPSQIGGGRYRVERFLGRGGRKRVYLAKDAESGRDVAVAVFDTEGVEATIAARARREAQAMSRLGDHPHIVAVEDSGEDEGRPYLVSPYLSGGDVEQLLEAAPGGRVEVERAVAIGTDLLRALDHAHSRNIVHRDIKPANVWLDAKGAARLGDFGLAATDTRSREAVQGMLVGTVAYLPPEQAMGRASDPRSDLYSLGCVLYEMLTGQPPFKGDDAVRIISQHVNAAPVAPSRHRREIPQALDDFVLRLLAKAPEDRPESAAAALAELEVAASAPDEPAADDEQENPLDRLAGGIFVGRERELDELRDGLDDTLAGRGHLMLLVGEPGIGKTRTAEELATYAQVRGARVHWGRCHEGEGAPAYWPWTQALRSFVRDADPVGLAWELGPSAPEVAQLVPEVRDRLGDVPEPPDLEPDQARFRLFDSITTFLRNASGSRPLMIVLDDLHWADEPSLLLLKFLARNLSDTGLLIVGTYRDVELGRHHPLAKTLAELNEIEQTRRVTLRGLDLAAIERFIEMTAGIEPPPGLAAAVHEQTEGNPFFLGEVVRLLASEQRLDPDGRGDWQLAIPQGVREVVGRRLDRLSDESNQVLAQAAAMGREFDIEVLAVVADCDRDMVERALDEAVEARVLAELPRVPGRFIFSHALVRETLYAEIPAARRVQLHGEIGEALIRRYGDEVDSHLAEVAHHLLEAAPGGGVERAVEFAERAAARASRQLAHEEAVKHLERALEVVESAATPPDRRLSLLLELGEARKRAGRFAAARETFDAAADLAQEIEDDERFVAATLGMVAVAEAGGVDERVLGLVRRSLDKVGDHDSAERSRLLTGLAQELYWKDPTGEARAALDEAIEMARRVGDKGALAEALMRRQFDLTANPRDRLELANELLEIAERAGADEMVVRSHAYRLNSLLMLGDIDGVDRELETYTRLAEKLRQPQHLWHIPVLRGTRAVLDGRFDEAERLAEEALAGGQRAEEPLSAQFYGIQMSVLHTLRGTVDEMIPTVRELAKRYPAIRAWRLALVSFLCESGRLDEGREEFERLAAHDFEDLPLDANYIIGVALISRAAWRLGDAERARLLYPKLVPYEGLTVVAGRAAACNGPVSLYLGGLALTLTRTADAIAHFERSIELSREMRERPFLAQGRIGLAEALLARDGAGDRNRALELLASVLEVGQELGMRPVVEEALALRLEAQGLSSVDVKTSIDTMISAVETERPDVRSFAAPDGTVTILFSDIEDSTLMAERLGDSRWIEVLRAHNSIFRTHLRAHGGHEVKSQGDGFMLVFPDPRRAVECAAAIQRDLAEEEVADGERISVRMGLHAGEAIREEGDFFGRSVILAARIAAKASGGEILVSEDVRQMVAPDDVGGNRADGANGDGLAFDSGRELELKGLAGTHLVFRARWEQQASPA